MIRVSHAILIGITAKVFIGLLWLQRTYYDIPWLEDLTVELTDGFWAVSALTISALTSPVAVISITIAGALLAAYEHHAKLWWLFTAWLAIGVSLSSLLKMMIMLPRPENAMIQLGAYGFPSTHATLATIIFITASWLAYYWNANYKHSIVMTLGGVWWVVGVSRVVLGVHSVSDVLAGILLGVAVSAIAIATAPALFDYFNIHKNTDPS